MSGGVNLQDLQDQIALLATAANLRRPRDLVATETRVGLAVQPQAASAEVHLADRLGVPAGGGEDAHEGRMVGKPSRQRVIRGPAGGGGAQAGDHAHARRHADRRRGNGVGERHAAACQGVDGGRVGVPAPGAAQCVAPQLVGHQQQNVRAVRRPSGAHLVKPSNVMPLKK